jgi:hypothetical protein
MSDDGDAVRTRRRGQRQVAKAIDDEDHNHARGYSLGHEGHRSAFTEPREDRERDGAQAPGHRRGDTNGGQQVAGRQPCVTFRFRANDIATVREFETTVAGYEQVLELRRMFGRPDCFIRLAVADHAAYEDFLTSRLIGLPRGRARPVPPHDEARQSP